MFVKAILYSSNSPIAIRVDMITAIVFRPPHSDLDKGCWDVFVTCTDKQCWTITYDSGWILHNTINDIIKKSSI